MIDDPAGYTDRLFHFGVVRLQIIIIDRPVDDVCPLDSAEFGQQPEILRFEAVEKSAHQI